MPGQIPTRTQIFCDMFARQPMKLRNEKIVLGIPLTITYFLAQQKFNSISHLGYTGTQSILEIKRQIFRSRIKTGRKKTISLKQATQMLLICPRVFFGHPHNPLQHPCPSVQTLSHIPPSKTWCHPSRGICVLSVLFSILPYPLQPIIKSDLHNEE